MQEFRGETPLPWQVKLPATWVIVPASSSEEVSGFQARNVRANEETRGSTVGHLALAVAARKTARKAAEAAKWYLDELSWAGLSFEAPPLAREPVHKRWKRGWFAMTALTYETYQGELRYRVLAHPKLWVVAGLVGVSREEDASAWMQNKRALDILTRSLRLCP
jgi:hypothetical protein